ncbi:MAG: hypothetical protein JSS56_23130 [Proteobacteria bacterium]|nr:hypothetical protein [Pseudomonadota bacterium]
MSTHDLNLLQAAREARADGRWMEAAVLLTEAADAVGRQVGLIGATELGLRRDAYLCLNFTTQFIEHRESSRKRQPRADFSEEWRQPSGDLARSLAALVTTPRTVWART